MQRKAAGVKRQQQRQQGETYRAAGVDTLASEALGPFLHLLQSTFSFGSPVELGFGHYANVVDLGQARVAISTDGVGTKALVAQIMGKYDTIGIDCVAMNVNDVVCVGARPQAMVDYLAVRRIDPRMLEEIGQGLAEGAQRADISIVGGELAQLPEMLQAKATGEAFDLAGTCIGTLETQRPITGAGIAPADAIIGLGSSGIHSNGLTLARRVLSLTNDSPARQQRRTLIRYYPELGESLGEALLTPTRIYVREVMEMLRVGLEIKGLAHITGDGLLNLPRLDADVGYVIDTLPETPAIFDLIQHRGNVRDEEMYEVFNMGIGFCVIVPDADVERAIAIAQDHGTHALRIGYVVEDPTRSVTVTPVGLRGWRGKGFQKLP